MMKEQTSRKAVVTFAGARDQYQLPLALAEAGWLDTFVTDAYFPVDQAWYQATLRHILPPKVSNARFREGISSRKVAISLQALLYSSIMQAERRFVGSSMNLYIQSNRALSRLAKQIALRHDAALFSCSYYAADAFAPTADRPTQRFLFMLHPHPVSVRRILTEELELTPFARDSLIREEELRNNTYAFERLSKEPELANGWTAASSFTKQTLVENGIEASNVHVTPYGVDTSAFTQRSASPSNTLFTVAFVGQMIQRKGLSYLLDAVRLLKTKRVQVILCGRGYIDKNLLAEYRDLNIEVNIEISHDQLIEKLYSSHIFVLPSLVEGFGHVIAEAMAVGLPVIVTPNTAGPDIVTDNREGFIVPIRAPQQIAEKLAWGIDHPIELAEMGRAATKRIKTFTWERFRAEVRQAYQQMLDDSRKV